MGTRIRHDINIFRIHALYGMDHNERCKKMVNAIDTLSPTELDELFRMFHRQRYEYTRNNHGVFINLSWVPETLLEQMEQYIEFCHRSKTELKKYESICDVLNTKFYEEKDAADPNTPTCHGSPSRIKATEEEPVEKSRVTTSMRFYLLKKRFAKTCAAPQNMESDLKPEPYVL
jgi:hypothetical protein